MMALFNSGSTACPFRVSHMYFEMFHFCFSIYFTPKIYIYLLYNCLSKLATHAVSEDKLKKTKQKTNRLLAD